MKKKYPTKTYNKSKNKLQIINNKFIYIKNIKTGIQK